MYEVVEAPNYSLLLYEQTNHLQICYIAYIRPNSNMIFYALYKVIIKEHKYR